MMTDNRERVENKSRCSSKVERLKRIQQMERSNPPAGSIVVACSYFMGKDISFSRCSSMVERLKCIQQMGCSNPPAGSKASGPTLSSSLSGLFLLP